MNNNIVITIHFIIVLCHNELQVITYTYIYITTMNNNIVIHDIV